MFSSATLVTTKLGRMVTYNEWNSFILSHGHMRSRGKLKKNLSSTAELRDRTLSM